MKKALKKTGILLLCLLAALFLAVGGYVIYVAANYSRIPDATALAVQNPQNETLETGQPYTALTFNIGFGAYNPAFSFFMDTGTMNDGTPVQGKNARAESREVVLENTEGVVGIVQQLAPDFMLFQEADVLADRSHNLDQVALLQHAFPQTQSVYASNFHSVFLAYPLHDMIGRIESGLLTLSPYKITAAERRSFPVDNGFPTKFFDLDRCFSVQRLPVAQANELVLINLHLSAFDEGGLIRTQQLEMLFAVLSQERTKGNWVVVGGDFNHALGGTLHTFASQQNLPPWVFAFDDTELPQGFSLVQADNADTVATCRSTDIPYTPGVNYSTVLDGFLVSDNVTAEATNINASFAFSDHNPVLLRFTLQPNTAP